MKKVILTGFGPFGPYQFNPTKELAEFYNGKLIWNAEVISIVLPCTYLSAFDVLSKVIDENHPDLIISLGLSSSLQKIRIETKFRNVMDGKYPDVDGFDPKDMQIRKDYSVDHAISPTSDSNLLEKVFGSHQIPFEISKNADFYFCNSLGYLTSYKLSQYPLQPIKNVFMHIPWTDDYSSVVSLQPPKVFIEKKAVLTAIDLCIDCFCNQQ